MHVGFTATLVADKEERRDYGIDLPFVRSEDLGSGEGPLVLMAQWTRR